MKLNLMYIFFLFLLTSTLSAKDTSGKSLNINIKEEGIFINEVKLSGTFKIDEYDPILGKYDLKESREDGLYYTWDKLGIKLREDLTSQTINQLSIYLVISRASDTKKPFLGKVNVLSKEVNAKVSPSKFSNDIICQQIFCTFKTENINVNTNLTEDKKKFKILLVKID